MRLAVFIATILAISAAIPVGMLFAGSSFTTQVTEPITEESAVVLQPPISKAEPPKEEVVIQSPELDEAAERQKEGLVIKPEPANIKSPQQPAMSPQAIQEVLRQGIPQNYVLKGALISIWGAQGNRGKDLVRANQTDVQLSLYPKFKDALQETDRRLSGYVGMCNRVDPDGIGPCGYGLPPTYLNVNEDEVASLIQLVNSGPPRDSVKGSGNVQRAYDVVITYMGNRHILLINTQWGSP